MTYGNGGGCTFKEESTSSVGGPSLERCIICMEVSDARGETSRAQASRQRYLRMAAEATAAVVMVVEMVVEATEAVVKGTAVEEAVEREGSGGGTNCSHSIACCRRLSNGLLACAELFGVNEFKPLQFRLSTNAVPSCRLHVHLPGDPRRA